LAMCGAHSKFVDADFNHLISLIEKFGSVISTQGASSAPAAVSLPKAVSPVQAAAIKHATSQSSISSSLGADSGVNLSPTHNEDKATSRPVVPAKVASGGIQMQSDVLSADQLEALQRSLAEQLAAFGIDASVLSGVTAGDMPVRRSRRLDATRKGPVQYRNEKSSIRPQLSIL
uniref:Pecanex-like protein n=1 Tax=Angiostrongylus cantonensis TaxID=6313 RepID=A0A0K0D5J0_ANGCA